MEKFRIPGLNGKLVAFVVKGDSMSPLVEAESMVICKEIRREEVKDGDVYLVLSKGAVWLKRVKLSGSRTRLISVNDGFKPFMIKDDLARYFKPVKLLVDFPQVQNK